MRERLHRSLSIENETLRARVAELETAIPQTFRELPVGATFEWLGYEPQFLKRDEDTAAHCKGFRTFEMNGGEPVRMIAPPDAETEDATT